MPNYCFYFFHADARDKVSIKARVCWLDFCIFVKFLHYNFFDILFRIRCAHRLQFVVKPQASLRACLFQALSWMPVVIN